MSTVGRGPQRLALVAVVSVTLSVPRVVSAAPAPAGAAPSAEPDAAAEDPDLPGDPGPGAMAPDAMPPEGRDALSPPGPAARAEAAFVQGERLLEQDRFLEAANAFARSYEALPNGPALYNMAYSYERADMAVAALRAYRRYLDRDDVGPREREELERTRRELRSRVAELVLDIQPGVSLAEIRIDDEAVGRDAFPWLLDPGLHTVEFLGERPEHHRIRTLEVQAGQVVRLDVPAFVDPPPAEEPPPRNPDPPADLASPPPNRERSSALRIAFWSGVGVTGASAISIAALGPLARQAKFDFENAQCGVDCEEGDRFPAAEKTRFDQLKVATNVMVGITAGFALVTAVLGAVAFAPRSRRPGSTRAQTHVGFGPGTLSVRF